MDFEQFKEELASSVKEIMYSKYGMEVEVKFRTMEKMNSSYEALTVKPDDSIIDVNLNATIYLIRRSGCIGTERNYDEMPQMQESSDTYEFHGRAGCSPCR